MIISCINHVSPVELRTYIWRHQRTKSDLSCLVYPVVLHVLDALNDDVDSECQDTDSDSDVVECEVECAGEEQELRTSNDSTSSTASLLSVLRAPKPSDLTRKRKLQCNPGKRKF